MLSKLSDTSLNAYYYALKTDRLEHESRRNVTSAKALRTVPDPLTLQPLFLSIDDTMVEKEGYHPANYYPALLNYYAVTNIFQQALLYQKEKGKN